MSNMSNTDRTLFWKKKTLKNGLTMVLLPTDGQTDQRTDEISFKLEFISKPTETKHA